MAAESSTQHPDGDTRDPPVPPHSPVPSSGICPRAICSHAEPMTWVSAVLWHRRKGCLAKWHRHRQRGQSEGGWGWWPKPPLPLWNAKGREEQCVKTGPAPTPRLPGTQGPQAAAWLGNAAAQPMAPQPCRERAGSMSCRPSLLSSGLDVLGQLWGRQGQGEVIHTVCKVDAGTYIHAVGLN